jgi:hypothetical protein
MSDEERGAKLAPLRIKVHRSLEAYNHDELELIVEVPEGADWREVEARYRREADEQLTRHWEEKRRLQEEVRLREAEEYEQRAKVLVERNARAEKKLAEGVAPCDGCDDPCGGCPGDDSESGPDEDDELVPW